MGCELRDVDLEAKGSEGTDLGEVCSHDSKLRDDPQGDSERDGIRVPANLGWLLGWINSGLNWDKSPGKPGMVIGMDKFRVENVSRFGVSCDKSTERFFPLLTGPG